MGKISVSLVKLAPWERTLPERLEVGGMVGGGGAGIALETFRRKLSGLFVFLAFGCGPW